MLADDLCGVRSFFGGAVKDDRRGARFLGVQSDTDHFCLVVLSFGAINVEDMIADGRWFVAYLGSISVEGRGVPSSVGVPQFLIVEGVCFHYASLVVEETLARTVVYAEERDVEGPGCRS